MTKITRPPGHRGAKTVATAEEARPVVRSAYSGMQRAMFRMLGIKRFLLLRLAPN